MATIFQDSFTEASDTALSLHTPDTGTSWTLVWQTGASSFAEVKGATDDLRPDATVANSGFMYSADATYPSADYEVSSTVKGGFTGTNRGYLIVRLQDQENMYALRFTTGSTGTRLYKKVSGTWTALGSFIADPAVNDVVTVRISGTTLTYYYNGTLKDTQTDSDISSAGKAGMAQGGGAELAASTDDILSTSVLDDFLVSTLTSGTTVTPGVASLTVSSFIPIATATDNKVVIPSATSLTSTLFAPNVVTGTNVVPLVATLTTAPYALTVNVSDNKTATPGIASISLSTSAPVVSTSNHQTVTPEPATLALTAFQPSVSNTLNTNITPNTTSLSITAFVPVVSVSDNKQVTPGVSNLVTVLQAPSVLASNNIFATPGALSLTTNAFVPSVSLQLATITPQIATLSTILFAPVVFAADPKVASPTALVLTMTMHLPSAAVIFLLPIGDSDQGVLWQPSEDIAGTYEGGDDPSNTTWSVGSEQVVVVSAAQDSTGVWQVGD